MELFVLFDTAGYRTPQAYHITDKQAVQRAATRRKQAREAKAKKAGVHLRNDEDDSRQAAMNSVVTKPSLEKEMALFKAIMRHIAKHELPEEQKRMFQMETRAKLRRLAPLGVVGNQPAIAAYCLIDAGESDQIEDAILQQKIGTNGKTMKAYDEFKQRISKRIKEGTYQEDEVDNTMLFKLTRVAKGATVRWKRSIRPKEQQQEELSSTLNNDDKPDYESRLIACLRCGQQQETSWMQLRTEQGYTSTATLVVSRSALRKVSVSVEWYGICARDTGWIQAPTSQKRHRRNQSKSKTSSRSEAEATRMQSLEKL